ncbi:helix-turn-helix domain-containing protein [Allopseudospirillum japonicum]|uniref:helix-turn-helix domain-containing protein n=1 Tax=Allopseudospirillum japonicum TaxID=64971 RepID=UPI0029500139|nr:helix-turn-helix domain-containing protein [Allopseudospirillum japonicum]
MEKTGIIYSMIKATKVRIYPTPEQAEFLSRQFGATRFVYNKALHIISSQYKRHGLKLKAKKDLLIEAILIALKQVLSLELLLELLWGRILSGLKILGLKYHSRPKI